ncbi:MAG: glycosyltransferase family 1 protein [Bdellovibrio sp.]|nr:MAG: glycosyltransferase family 1 protein [Bdellovibrio sp.]
MSRPHVVFLVNNPRFFLSHRLPLAQEALRSGYRVSVVAPPWEGYDEISRLGFSVFPIFMDRKSVNPLKELQIIKSLYKALQFLQPDILHNFTIKPVIYGTLVGRFLKVPQIINTMTGLGYVFNRHGLRGFFLRAVVGILYRWAFSSASVQVIFQNRDDRRFFLKKRWVSKEQSRVILGSGVDAQKFSPRPQPPFPPVKILFVGRLMKDKGVSELVQAVSLLKQKGYEVELWLVGPHNEGNPTDIPLGQLKTWEQEEFIHWFGEQQDVRPFIEKTHIFCLPSYREGLPLSLLEAAACARPLVATHVPGCREVVISGQNGFLAEPRNSHDLALQLQKLVEDELLRQRMGEASRQRVEALFVKEKVVAETLDLYHPQEIKKAA